HGVRLQPVAARAPGSARRRTLGAHARPQRGRRAGASKRRGGPRGARALGARGAVRRADDRARDGRAARPPDDPRLSRRGHTGEAVRHAWPATHGAAIAWRAHGTCTGGARVRRRGRGEAAHGRRRLSALATAALATVELAACPLCGSTVFKSLPFEYRFAGAVFPAGQCTRCSLRGLMRQPALGEFAKLYARDYFAGGDVRCGHVGDYFAERPALVSEARGLVDA